jgi:hypothetical protein
MSGRYLNGRKARIGPSLSLRTTENHIISLSLILIQGRFCQALLFVYSARLPHLYQFGTAFEFNISKEESTLFFPLP